MAENEEREDCLTQVANIADIRAFRFAAMHSYDQAITRGISPQNAQSLAIEVVQLLNKYNIKEV